MDHPCLITLDSGSAPRVLFSGDRLVEVALPPGSRVLYPKPPLASLKDFETEFRRAIEAPQGAAPLASKLRPGMRVTIAVEDASVPVPAMASPDVRQTVLELLCALLARHGVNDVEIIMATGLNRRLRDAEIRHLVGRKVFAQFAPRRLYNHDAEEPNGLVALGETEFGEPVEIHRRAAESELLILVNVCTLPIDGGFRTVCLGLGSRKSARAHLNPTVLRHCFSTMDPQASGLFTSLERMGKVVSDAIDVFAIEVTLDNHAFTGVLSFLAKNEDDHTERERFLAAGLVEGGARMPRAARRAVLGRMRAGYGITAVFAGDVQQAHARAVEVLARQHYVPVDRQADVLVAGIPEHGPYNIGASLNPLLVQHMAEGVAFNLYRGSPLVKKGGTLILTHPCTDRFDHEQHSAYIDFVHRLLPETRDGLELERRYEDTFAHNPAFLEMYKRGHSYHPVHPFFMWYWGEAARQHLGKVIVVGADNEYVPRLLGYETAPNIEEALYRARGGEPRTLDILCLHVPPFTMGDVAGSST